MNDQPTNNFDILIYDRQAHCWAWVMSAVDLDQAVDRGCRLLAGRLIVPHAPRTQVQAVALVNRLTWESWIKSDDFLLDRITQHLHRAVEAMRQWHEPAHKNSTADSDKSGRAIGHPQHQLKGQPR